MAHEPLLTLSDNDNIAVALQKKSNPATSSIHRVLSQSAIPSGHKIALTEITSGEEIIKYGRVIGLVTQDIQRGEHVHMKRAYL
jgi:altronate dehydratase